MSLLRNHVFQGLRKTLLGSARTLSQNPMRLVSRPRVLADSDQKSTRRSPALLLEAIRDAVGASRLHELWTLGRRAETGRRDGNRRTSSPGGSRELSEGEPKREEAESSSDPHVSEESGDSEQLSEENSPKREETPESFSEDPDTGTANSEQLSEENGCCSPRREDMERVKELLRGKTEEVTRLEQQLCEQKDKNNRLKQENDMGHDILKIIRKEMKLFSDLLDVSESLNSKAVK